jgi:hypothetical protein
MSEAGLVMPKSRKKLVSYGFLNSWIVGRKQEIRWK